MSISVCLSARIIRKPHDQTSPIFVDVAHGHGSVLLLLWYCYSMLCTSSFVDDVIFTYNVSMACHVYYKVAIWQASEIPTNFWSTMKMTKYSSWVVHLGQSLLYMIALFLLCLLHWLHLVEYSKEMASHPAVCILCMADTLCCMLLVAPVVDSGGHKG